MNCAKDRQFITPDTGIVTTAVVIPRQDGGQTAGFTQSTQTKHCAPISQPNV
jgi:hypothetical protein